MYGIGAIVLAAGASTRLGQPKQLIEFRGETLVHATVRAAQEAGCDPVCLVTGHAREAVERAVADLSPLLVHNENWQRGMGSSIRLGVRAISSSSAVILLTCDQPAVNTDVIRSLIARHERTGLAIVASHYAETLGIPALFHQSCFDELEDLPDESGAKPVIQAGLTRVASFEFPAGALDLDSPADLEGWQREA